MVAAPPDARVAKGPPGACHVWLGKLHHSGTPVVSMRGVWRYAPRMIWELHYKGLGALPKPTYLTLLCGNPRCVNPHHRAPTLKTQRRRSRLSVRGAKAIRAALVTRASPGGAGGFSWHSGRLIADRGAVVQVAQETHTQPLDVLAVYGQLAKENRETKERDQ